jgi:hypothetical protein
LNKTKLERGIKKLKAGLDDCHKEMREFEIKQLDSIIDGLSFHLSHYEIVERHDKKEKDENG